MFQILDKKIVIQEYESVYELETLKIPEYNLKSLRFNRIPTKMWLGKRAESIESFMHNIWEPWDEGMEEYNRVRKEIESSLQTPLSIKKRLKFSSEGDYLDVDKFYSYNYETMWVTPKRAKVVALKNITLYTDLCGSGTDEYKMFLARGTVTSILVDVLENAGYCVEVIGIIGASNSYEYNFYEKKEPPVYYFCTIPLKTFQEPLDVQKLIIVTGLSGFFRTFGFKAIASLPYKVTTELGYPVNGRFPKLILNLLPNMCFLITGYFDTAKQCLKEINTIISMISQGKERNITVISN